MTGNETIMAGGQSMTLNALITQVVAILEQRSVGVGEFPVATSAAGVSSLPAIRQSGTTREIVALSLDLLKGAAGTAVRIRFSETALQWQYEGESVWTPLITLAQLQQPAVTAAAAIRQEWEALRTEVNSNVSTALTNLTGAVETKILEVQNDSSALQGAWATIRQEAIAATSAAVTAAAGAQASAEAATEAVETVQATVTHMEELEASITEVVNTVPRSVSLEYPFQITASNTDRVRATLYPFGADRNVLFFAGNDIVTVSPDGAFKAEKPGVGRIHVIPTLNTAIAQIAYINVLPPYIRATQQGNIRALSSDRIRFT
jgi:hypothetical protein